MKNLYRREFIQKSASIALGCSPFYLQLLQKGIPPSKLSISKSNYNLRCIGIRKEIGSCYLDVKENFVFLCNGTSFEIIEILNSERVLSLSKYPLPSEPTNIIVIDDYAYIVIENEGIIVLDIKDKRFPKPIGKFETAVRISGFFNYEKLLYLNMDGKVLKILDIRNPSKFVEIGNIYESSLIDFLIKGDFAYCINHFEGLKIFDIKNPKNPKLISSLKYNWAFNIHNLYSYKYFLCSHVLGTPNDNKVETLMIDATNEENPLIKKVFEWDVNTIRTNDQQRIAYVTDFQRNGIAVLDISIPPKSKELGFYKTKNFFWLDAVLEDCFLGTEKEKGIVIYRYK
ncbi:hypothetical protein IID62_02110 [candidate division KSB1 bacterium]|nr:hypothetical protein [candidate division KSB1 bacterium]